MNFLTNSLFKNVSIYFGIFEGKEHEKEGKFSHLLAQMSATAAPG